MFKEGGNIFGHQQEQLPSQDSDKEKNSPESLLWENIKNDNINQRLTELLIALSIISFVDGNIVFDYDKYCNTTIKDYLGTEDGNKVYATKKQINKFLADYDIVMKADYGQGKKNYKSIEEAYTEKQFGAVRDRFLSSLEKEGILRKVGGIFVMDLAKFSLKKYSSGTMAKINNRQIRYTRANVFELLSDLQVVSEADFQKVQESESEPLPKPLFNVPADKEEAFDLSAIKNKDYYLNVWDINKANNVHWNKRIKARNKDSIRMNELYLAHLIYREHEGERINKGQKDEQLIIRENGEKKKISYDWINDNTSLLTARRGGIHNYLQKQCPNLLQKGLLKFGDFRINTAGADSNLLRKEYFPHNNKLELAYNSVRYYIGREFFIFGKEKIPINNLKVVVLDQETLGVVVMHEGREELKYTIDTLNQEEIGKKRALVRERLGSEAKVTQITAHTRIGKREIDKRTKKYSATNVISQKPGEDREDFEARRTNISNYGYIKRITDKFAKECGIGIQNLSWRQQVWLASATYDLGVKDKYKEIVDFTKKYGAEGLKSFLSFEYDRNYGDKIIEIGKQLDPEQVKRIFNKYAGIQESVEVMRAKMDNSKFMDSMKLDAKLKNNLPDNSYDALLSRATDILTGAHRVATQGSAKAQFYNGREIEVKNIDEVIKAMDIYEDFLEKMKGFFTEESKYKFEYLDSTDHEELQLYNFAVSDTDKDKQSFATISIRSAGTNKYLENLEYDGEARINFLFSDERISPDIRDKSRQEATTFRLDRECLVFDESGEKVLGRDNTKKKGKLSFDFGSIYDDAGEENNTLGRVISVGNYHASLEKNKKPEYYHNKESFYHELGEAKAFAEIAQAIDNFINTKYAKTAQRELKEAA